MSLDVMDNSLRRTSAMVQCVALFKSDNVSQKSQQVNNVIRTIRHYGDNRNNRKSIITEIQVLKTYFQQMFLINKEIINIQSFFSNLLILIDNNFVYILIFYYLKF